MGEPTREEVNTLVLEYLVERTNGALREIEKAFCEQDKVNNKMVEAFDYVIGRANFNFSSIKSQMTGGRSNWNYPEYYKHLKEHCGL